MKKLFSHKKNARDNKDMDKAATHIAAGIIAVQKKIANWLSIQEKKLTLAQKKFALLIFFVAMATVAGSLLIRGVAGHHPGSIPGMQSITPAKTYPLPDSLGEDPFQKQGRNGGRNNDSFTIK